MKTLHIIDGNFYLRRAWSVLSQVTGKAKDDPTLGLNKYGRPVGGLIGMLSSMGADINAHGNSSHKAVVFDTFGPTFRNEMYSEYKANRHNPDPEHVPDSGTRDHINSQVRDGIELFRLLAIPCLQLPGVEGDDVMGSLAKQCSERFGTKVQMFTADKDMGAVVTDLVHTVNTKDEFIGTPKTIQQKFGVLPEQMHHYLALCGDSVDNIPGVRGIGPDRAVTLLKAYGTCQGIYQNLDKLTPAIRKLMEEGKENCKLSLRLSTLKTDIILTDQFLTEGLKVGKANKQGSLDFLASLDIKPAAWIQGRFVKTLFERK